MDFVNNLPTWAFMPGFGFFDPPDDEKRNVPMADFENVVPLEAAVLNSLPMPRLVAVLA